MKIWRVLAVLFLTAQTCFAQTVAPDLIDPERQLREQIEQETRERDVRQFQGNERSLGEKLINPEGATDGPCVNVYDIIIEGVTLIDEDYIAAILKGRFPGCLRRFHISHLMRTLDKTYIDRGYITARTYIPKQDVKGTGVLKLKVIEGKVEDVILQTAGEVVRSPLTKWTAFKSPEGEYLNVRDFEQGLEQLNRQSSISAKMRLEPGTQAGGSVVVVDRAIKDRYRGFVGWDNLGSPSTGEREIRVQMSADGVLNANDVASFVYVGSVNANAVNASFSVPVGYNTFTASASLSDYLLPLSDVAELLGQTQAYTMSWDRVIYRDARSITNISAALRYRLSDRFINAVALTPQNTTVADVRMRKIINRENARWSWEIGLRSGLPWFGALTDQGPLTSDQAHAEFQAIDFSLSRYGNPTQAGRWSASLRGQISGSTALYGSEQLSFGSQSSVRGFKEPIIGGDSGAALRLDRSFPLSKLSDLTFDISKSENKAVSSFFRKSQIYVFTDIGGVYSYGLERARAAFGVGFGYKYRTRKIQFDVGMQSGLANTRIDGFKRGDTRVTSSLSLKVF